MSDSVFRPFEALSAGHISLANSVCDRFERAWIEGNTPSIQDFLATTPNSVHQVLLRELILIEVHYRTKHGETLGAETYKRLLPGIDSQWLSENLSRASLEGSEHELVVPPQLARYEVVGEAGRGGMGSSIRLATDGSDAWFA